MVVLAITLITFILPESFRSTARLKLEWGRENAIPLSDARLVQTEVEVIESELTLGKVVEVLDLNEEWGRRYNEGQSLKTSESVRLLKGMLEARASQNHNVVGISFYSQDPTDASRVANAIMDAYISQSNADTNGLKVTMIEKARPSLRPVRPNKPLNIICGMLLGTVLGLTVGGVVTLLAMLRPKA